MTVLLGPSGTGKTSILNLIAGFIKPAAGVILFNGEEISQDLMKTGSVITEIRTSGMSFNFLI